MKKTPTLRRLAGYYKPYLPLLIADLVAVVLIAAVSLVVPYLLRHMVDALIPQRDFHALILLGWAVAGAALIKYGSNYFTLYAGHLMAARMERDLRRDLFDKLCRMSYSFFDRRNTGDLMSRMTNDVGKVTDAVNHAPEDILLSILTVGGSAVLLFSLEPLLATLCTVPLLFMAAYSGLLGGKIRSGFESINEAIADINSRVENIVSGIRTVQAFAMEDAERRRFGDLNERHYQAWRSALNRLGWFSSGIDLMKDLSRLLVIVAGGWMALSGRTSVGTVVAFLAFVPVYMEPIERLSRTVELVQRMRAGLVRYFEVLDEREEIQDPPHPSALPSSDKEGGTRGLVEFDGVSFSYDGNRHVFRNLSTRLEPGRTVALVGPSGAGKTSFASLIPRFYEAREGIIRLDGVDIRSLALKDLRGSISIVQQDVTLFAGTVRENVAYGRPESSIQDLRDAAQRANALSFIEALPSGWDTWIGERGVRLSGGQRQRLSIARAFLKDAPVLILDEATSSLDSESEAAVHDALRRLMTGRTTLIIAHRLSTVREADDILVLAEDSESSGIVERGTHAELISLGGLYSRYYAGQTALS